MNAIAKHETGAVALAEDDLLRVLGASLYPGANVDSIRLVLGYCKASGLDPMQKPVHIVPMWDSKARQMRDVVMPGVNLYRTQASRSNQMAGITEPEFGPMVTADIGGQRITHPEWCKVTVRRLMANGQTAEFSAVEYWMENYAVKGGQEKSIAPNAMWTKRPRGQIAKCAEAQALRKAFPEIGGAYTAEEMEGKTIQAEDNHDTLREECAKLVADATTADELKAASKEGVRRLNAARDTAGYPLFVSAVKARGEAIRKAEAVVDVVPTEPTDSFVVEMEAAEAGK